jgi:hypothetical protein
MAGWNISKNGDQVRIDFPGGFNQEMPLAAARKYFLEGLNACDGTTDSVTSKSQAVASAGGEKRSGAPKKASARKGAAKRK